MRRAPLAVSIPVGNADTHFLDITCQYHFFSRAIQPFIKR